MKSLFFQGNPLIKKGSLKIFYYNNYVKVILYRTNSIYICTSGKRTVLYSIRQIGCNRKSHTQYSMVSLGILNLMLPIIVQIHICLSTINRISTSQRNGNSPIDIDDKCENKEERLPLGMKFYLTFPKNLSQKIESGIAIFFYWIRRDWRGSNPQLPPWQGGALTNWTTIPSKYHNKIKYYVYIFLWFYSNPFNFEFRFKLAQSREWYIDTHMGMRFSENNLDY